MQLSQIIKINNLSHSISLEDSYSVAINIPAKSPTIPSSPVKNIQMTPYSPLSTFSTFHPLGQDRTSPEGSSCGEPDRDREEQEEKVVKEEEDAKDDKVVNNEERECLYAKVSGDDPSDTWLMSHVADQLPGQDKSKTRHQDKSFTARHHDKSFTARHHDQSWAARHQGRVSDIECCDNF